MGNRLWLFSASPSSFFPLSHTGSEALSSSQGHSREHSSTWSHALGQGGPHPAGAAAEALGRCAALEHRDHGQCSEDLQGLAWDVAGSEAKAFQRDLEPT